MKASPATVLLLLLFAGSPAAEPTPEIPYPGEKEFVWWSPGGDYRSYSLRLSAVQHAEVHATFVLIQDGKLRGRFPLRKMDHTDPRLPIKFNVACLSQSAARESWIQVDVIGGDGQTHAAMEFHLVHAVDEKAAGKKAKPQPDGSGNSHRAGP